MDLVDKPLAALLPHPQNPRQHPAAQLEVLETAQTIHGQQKNIVLWGGGPDEFGAELPPDTILAGHGWVQMLRARGDTTVQASYYTGTHPTTFMLMDNRAPELAVDDQAALLALLQEARSQELLAGSGYSEYRPYFTPSYRNPRPRCAYFPW